MATRLVNKRSQFIDVFQNVLVYTDTAFNPANAATGSGTFSATDVVVTGAALGDVVLVSFSLDAVDTVVTAAVTAANTVTVVVLNNTAGAVDLAAGKLILYVLQPNTQLTA
jgi:hypothetical protein